MVKITNNFEDFQTTNDGHSRDAKKLTHVPMKVELKIMINFGTVIP
jgi:hypothetical protein